MNNEEAIKILKEPCKDCDCHWEYGSEKCKMHDCYTALEMAIEALEKQVEKKPIEDEYCPICGASLELDGDYGYIHKLKYCQRCGQKIDWSDEYDE